MNSSLIKTNLKKIPGWKYSSKNKAIWIEIKCKNFMAAVKMIHKIARLAEKAGHHPDLHLTDYRCLIVVLTTHDASSVTMKDFKLAYKLQKIMLPGERFLRSGG